VLAPDSDAAKSNNRARQAIVKASEFFEMPTVCREASTEDLQSDYFCRPNHESQLWQAEVWPIGSGGPILDSDVIDEPATRRFRSH